jgi:hypothetical protein
VVYENQKYRFKYPQDVPHIMPIQDPFNRENNKLLLTILLKTGKKYRKIAKGEINIYKKYFMTENLSVQKWVYLNLYENQLEQMGHSTNILKAVTNTGRIFLKAQLMDPLLEGGEGIPKQKNAFDSISVYTATTHASAMTKILKNNLKNISNTKDKASANKTEKYRSITEHSNDFLRSLKNKKNLTAEDIFEDIEEEEKAALPQKEEFNDGLSDVSISIIDNQEDNREIDIEKMNFEIDELVSKIKVIFDNKIDEILPQDPEELKNFVKNFTSQIGNISENYSQNLLTLADINKRIKFQAKDYYERYKETKKVFKRERRELKQKSKQLESEVQTNNNDRIKLQNRLDEVKNELSFFKHKMGIVDGNSNTDEDFILLLEIINSLEVQNNAELFDGLDDGEREVMNSILSRYNLGKPDGLNEANLNDGYHEIQEQELENEDIIISKIEDIVNENFKNKKIHNIKIEQVNDDTFKFNDKNVTLYLVGETLKVREKGYETFEDWVLAHFGRGVLEKSSPVKKPSVTNKNPIQAMIDKKLAEKKMQMNKTAQVNSTNTARNKTPNSKKE